MTHDKEKVKSDGWPLFLFPRLAAVLFTQILAGKKLLFLFFQYILFLWQSSQNSYLITKAMAGTKSFSVGFPRFEDNRTILKESKKLFIME